MKRASNSRHIIVLTVLLVSSYFLAQSQAEPIRYTVTKEWPVGKDIVVPNGTSNDDLIALVRSISTNEHSVQCMFIYNNMKKAKERFGAIGMYTRNHNNIDELMIMPDGDIYKGITIDLNQPSGSTKPLNKEKPIDSSPPIVVDGSTVDSSIELVTVIYTAGDKNLFGQPMEVFVSSKFATDPGLVAVARQLEKDNAKYRKVLMPVQIFETDNRTHELAEYFDSEEAHDLRITGPSGLIRKIVKFPKSK